jgi:hypothetical protein
METHTNQSHSTTASDRMGVNGNEPHNPSDAFRDLGDRIAELKSFAGYYITAKLDGIKLSLRNLVLYAALGIVGLIAGGTIIVMASALLVMGISHGLGALFGGRYWLGDLVTGILFLGLIAAGVIFGLKAVTKSSRKRTVEKYEQWQHDQRQHFGTDVCQAARSGK